WTVSYLIKRSSCTYMYTSSLFIAIFLVQNRNTSSIKKVQLSITNSIDKINSFLTEDSLSIIKNTYQQLAIGKVRITNGHVVSNLTFGFWISLFSKRYYKNFSVKEIKSIFNISRNLINENKLNHIYHDLSAIKNFRDRIFHYEKVNNHKLYINIDNLLDKYLKLIDVENVLNESFKKINLKLQNHFI
ncbi:MAG: hypothetical protein QG673_1483, partial [Pseudomonadota bacterium]|nr:hypothetical protein [Pseudomonadota bacterium]